MRIRSLIALILITLMPSLAMGQSKIGKPGLKFLDICPSVRSNGMGEAGVALVDNYSVYYNPGSLGLLHVENRGQITFYPVKAKLYEIIPYEYYSASARAVTINVTGNIPLSISVAYYKTNVKHDSIEVTSYEYPDGSGEYKFLIDKAHNFSLGLGVTGKIDVGLGLTYKYIKEDFYGFEGDANAFDFGILVRLPSDELIFSSMQDSKARPFFSPSLGYSICNVGSDMELADYKFPLPEFRRWGFAASFGLDLGTEDIYLNLFKITPSYEISKAPSIETSRMFGAELYLMDAIAGRIGRKENGHTRAHYNTWGVGFRSRGIVRILTDLLLPRPSTSRGGLARFLRDDLNIEFEFSRKDRRIYNEDMAREVDKYYGISISI